MIDDGLLANLLGRLCPMHLILDTDGVIRHAGATLQKLRPDIPMEGRRFLEVFDMIRPRAVNRFRDLLDDPSVKLKIAFRDAPHTTLKGEFAEFPGGAVIALSFGISLIEAVRDYNLTSADFPATDLAIELLYLVEAKSLVEEATRQLTLRLQAAKISAEEQAFTDTLTGLKNRRALEHVMARLQGGGMPYSVVHLDLDFFKEVNDTLGHAAGDYVLQEVARALVEETRRADTVARVGGDEFVIIFDNLTDRLKLQRIAARLIERLEQPMRYQGRQCAISASIGIAMSGDEPASAPAELLGHADQALYAAKRAGRATLRFYNPTATAQEPPAAVERRRRDATG